jgi:hypothetical protein
MDYLLNKPFDSDTDRFTDLDMLNLVKFAYSCTASKMTLASIVHGQKRLKNNHLS